ncbi:uncharacterized protein N7496_009472 [Penicillium cataractarum]|uniref:Zn(2)-C6 fungal-type domain-containing protein n=1 Tax=Penicillium cataractarum TaxID=2100454 RepID=A0A9W9V106_9EURO|nr:uncharacterized protein N7496_009472 [Penicillium cataractarum]KAJ5363759.1 hypothetical protein N7496_009472 [Penicillium cataractarum]
MGADHLIRYVRSHTLEKPELLKLHAAGHTGKRKRPPPSNGRVPQACATCAESKLKCDVEKPCKRYKEKGLDCEWPASGPKCYREVPIL